MSDEHHLETVRNVWLEVLGIAAVGDDTTFFDAGGDSLRLVILVERLNQATGRSLKTIDLFRAGTVRGHAGLLSAAAIAVPVPAGPSSRDRLLQAARIRGAAPQD